MWWNRTAKSAPLYINLSSHLSDKLTKNVIEIARYEKTLNCVFLLIDLGFETIGINPENFIGPSLYEVVNFERRPQSFMNFSPPFGPNKDMGISLGAKSH